MAKYNPEQYEALEKLNKVRAERDEAREQESVAKRDCIRAETQLAELEAKRKTEHREAIQLVKDLHLTNAILDDIKNLLRWEKDGTRTFRPAEIDNILAKRKGGSPDFTCPDDEDTEENPYVYYTLYQIEKDKNTEKDKRLAAAMAAWKRCREYVYEMLAFRCFEELDAALADTDKEDE